MRSMRGSRYFSWGWGVGWGGLGGFKGGGVSHRKLTCLIIQYFDFRISVDVSSLQEKSMF